jgi:cobalt-zinc-cadmium efflux system protein
VGSGGGRAHGRHGHGGHGHGGGGHGALTAAGRYRGRLRAVLLITVSVLAAEVVGAVVSGSLVLLADAGHMAADAAGIGLALLGVWFGARPPTARRTFGYQRAEILAAAVDAALLFGATGYILVQAVRRFVHPPEVGTAAMIAFGAAALAGNLCSLALLRAGQAESLNLRGAFLEVLADALGAAAVIAAALVVALTGFRRADAIAAGLIGLLIIPRTWRLLRDALDILLEATPRDVDLTDVRRHLLDTPGVVDVHDLHAWTITSGLPVLSAHVVVADEAYADGGRVLDRLCACLAGHFDVEHCTFQLEPTTHAEHETGVHH